MTSEEADTTATVLVDEGGLESEAADWIRHEVRKIRGASQR